MAPSAHQSHSEFKCGLRPTLYSELDGVAKNQTIFIGAIGVIGVICRISPLCRYVLERAALYCVSNIGDALPFLAILSLRS
ncbi:hypothetical protein D3C75_1258590 [compost metagenome]